MEAVKHVVVGAGVVGLAVAARLSRVGSTIVLERNARIGEETSARNSEVIHAGITTSIPTEKLCIAGRHLLYKVCDANGLPYKRTGKWIVAQDEEEKTVLQAIHARATKLNVPVRWVPADEVKSEEPHLRAHTVLESTQTGIIDSHSLMVWLQGQLEGRGGFVALSTPLTGIEPLPSGAGYIVHTADGPIQTEVLVNSAGLYADAVARMAMGDRFPSSIRCISAAAATSYQGKSPVRRLVYRCRRRTWLVSVCCLFLCTVWL